MFKKIHAIIFVIVSTLLMNSFLYASKTTLLLIRHGETDWNREQRAQGHTDIPLNQTGILQANATAIQLKTDFPSLKAIYSSDLARAYATAQCAAEKCALPIEKRANLREIYRGVAEGMTREDIFKTFHYKQAATGLRLKYPERQERWKYTIIPGEESLSLLEQRIRNELFEICRSHPNEIVAIFSHGTAIKTLLASIKGCEIEEIEIPNCAITSVDFDSESGFQSFTISLP